MLLLRSLVPFFLPCHTWSALKISLGHIVGNLSEFRYTFLSSAFQSYAELIEQNTANPIYIVSVGIQTGSLTPLVPWARLVNFCPRVCQPVRRGCAFNPAPDTIFLNEQSTPQTALVGSSESRRLVSYQRSSTLSIFLLSPLSQGTRNRNILGLLTFWHRIFTFNSNKSPTSCNSFSGYYPDFCLQLFVSGVFPPIIRSSMTAVADSGFNFVSWWQSCCVRGQAGRHVHAEECNKCI
jgi:hypothetical protein